MDAFAIVEEYNKIYDAIENYIYHNVEESIKRIVKITPYVNRNGEKMLEVDYESYLVDCNMDGYESVTLKAGEWENEN